MTAWLALLLQSHELLFGLGGVGWLVATRQRSVAPVAPPVVATTAEVTTQPAASGPVGAPSGTFAASWFAKLLTTASTNGRPRTKGTTNTTRPAGSPAK